MASVSEGLCFENLVWSDVEYSLAGFVENLQEPQIVRVESGYFGGNDSTSLTSGQVVQLHCVRKIKKFACQTADGKSVALPYTYPVKCVVENREFSKISALPLSILSDQVKYILTLGDYDSSKSPNSNSFQEGAILEITGVDTKGKCIQCRDVSTTKRIQFHFNCTALFCPLRDCNQYTLAEVVEKFEIPVKVRFLRQSSEATIDPNLPSFVSNLQEVSILDVIEQTVVVMTTLGENSTDVCLEITKDIPVYVRVAQEFLENEVIYVRMVKPLDRLFESRFEDYENVASVTTRYECASVDYDVNNEDSEFRCRKFAYQRPPAACFQQLESSPISKANTASIRSLENAQPTQNRRESSDEEPAYLETKDLWPMIKPRKSDSEINYNRNDTQKGDKTALPAHDEELIYVEVIDPKPEKILQKSNIEINYMGSNARKSCIPNRMGDKKARPVPVKRVRIPRKSDITCNRTGNKGRIPSQTEDGKALPDASNPKPLFISKENLLSEIEKRKMHRKENKNYEGETDTPRTTRNITPEFPNKQIAKLPEKKLPSKVLSTPKTDELNELASLQAKRLNKDQQNSDDEIYYELTTVRNSDSVLSMSPDCFLSLSPVKTSALPKNLSGLSVKDVTKILCALDLERYAGIFEEELIDGAMLESMDEEILKSIGMKPFHVKRMIRFINGWRPNIR
ncbi:SH3 and multiple ankyrin repeat domains 2-like [Paramuricea clavata]|uniref:SH3 and multiple ankyrin repeat domains 2-like n=1 Tax=Paramuricea clavata TaxID=317549 RepID=A0A6S7FMU3_PARCT|nr:SH3 and multiple ankyrin repeat domains 2-like [Paramuricea clavata]